MKHSGDFQDRLYGVFVTAEFDQKIAGKIILGNQNEFGNEYLIIRTLPVGHDFGVVDNSVVYLSLYVKDVNGSVNQSRFNALIAEIDSVLTDAEACDYEINQYSTDEDGVETTAEISGCEEYFKFRSIFSDGPNPDPERPGYSVYILRLDCWIEK